MAARCSLVGCRPSPPDNSPGLVTVPACAFAVSRLRRGGSRFIARRNVTRAEIRYEHGRSVACSALSNSHNTNKPCLQENIHQHAGIILHCSASILMCAEFITVRGSNPGFTETRTGFTADMSDRLLDRIAARVTITSVFLKADWVVLIARDGAALVKHLFPEL